MCARWSAAPLDMVEAQVATAGQRLLGRLCKLQWEEMDAQAAARYAAAQAPGSVERDGAETLAVASRFGTLYLRRQVCAHTDGRPHVMPGNDVAELRRRRRAVCVAAGAGGGDHAGAL